MRVVGKLFFNMVKQSTQEMMMILLAIAPFLTGVVATEISLRTGMLINVIYPIAFILIIRKLIKK